MCWVVPTEGLHGGGRLAVMLRSLSTIVMLPATRALWCENLGLRERSARPLADSARQMPSPLRLAYPVTTLCRGEHPTSLLGYLDFRMDVSAPFSLQAIALRLAPDFIDDEWTTRAAG
jgi:hypothetical protein